MGATASYPTPTLPSSRTVVVTGGNTGIGYETAKAIARMGARVIIACRSEERAKKAIERMQKEHNESTKETKSGSEDISNVETEDKEKHQLLVEYMHLDLSSLSSTVEFVKAYKQTGYPLHVLICNAGIAFANQGLTEDGFEMHFQVNYLSHLLLVLNLLPVMKESVPDVRVIFVSSMIERWGELNLDNIQGQQSYDRSKLYENSKLYMIMAMFYLHRQLAYQGSLTFCALHPGMVSGTEVGRSFQDFTLLKYAFSMSGALGFLKTRQQGAVTTINCAVNPELAGVSGVYYDNCAPKQPSQLARNEKEQDKLWKYSIECLKKYLDENVLSESGLNVTNGEHEKELDSQTAE